MSNLTVTNINGKNAEAGRVKARCFLQVLAGLPVVKGSYNVSSLTDCGAGRYGHNLVNPMLDTEFSLSALSKSESNNLYINATERFNSIRTVSFFEVNPISYVNGSTSDVGGAGYGFSSVVFGEQA